MAKKCGLYFHTAGIESAGTNADTGKRAGTLVSIGGSTPLVLPVLSTVYTAYFRTIDDATLDDPGYDSTTNIVLTLPAHLEACTTYNGTFAGTSLDTGVHSTGGNQPVYLKQTALADASAASLSIGALAWTTGTRVGSMAAITPTGVSSSGNSIVWTWTAPTGSPTGYEYRVSSTTSFSGAWTDAGNALTATTTGLSAGNTRYAQVRAYNANGVGTVSATSAAVTVAILFLDFAAGAADDLTNFPRSLAGSGTSNVASNKCNITSPSANDAAIRYFAHAIDTSVAERYTIKAQATAAPNNLLALRFWGGGVPAAMTDALFGTHSMAGISYVDTTHAWISYYSSGHVYSLDPATGTWGAADTYPTFTISAATDYTFIAETRPNSGTPQIRFILADASGTAVTNGTSPWLNLSTIYAGQPLTGSSTPRHLFIGEAATDTRTGTIDVKLAKVELI